MWLFDSPKNYTDMIDKISKCAFFITLILIFILTGANTDFAEFMKNMSFGVQYKFMDIDLYMSMFYLPLLIGILEHSIKIHDKISTCLGIRDNFDNNVIVYGMCKKLKDNFEKTHIPKLHKIVMRQFYEYASSTKPKIDEHYIHLALGVWCWFWIILDTLVLISLTGVIFVIWFFSCKNLFILLSIILALLIFMKILYVQAKKAADKEIDEILKFDDAKKLIEEEIDNALSNC